MTMDILARYFYSYFESMMVENQVGKILFYRLSNIQSLGRERERSWSLLFLNSLRYIIFASTVAWTHRHKQWIPDCLIATGLYFESWNYNIFFPACNKNVRFLVPKFLGMVFNLYLDSRSELRKQIPLQAVLYLGWWKMGALRAYCLCNANILAVRSA